MSNSLTINTPNIVQQNTPLRGVPSGSTAEPDYSVKYIPQTLSEEQKAQARANIGAAEEGGGGTQVQSDWNQTDNTQPDYIKNKPVIPQASMDSIEFETDVFTFYSPISYEIIGGGVDYAQYCIANNVALQKQERHSDPEDPESPMINYYSVPAGKMCLKVDLTQYPSLNIISSNNSLIWMYTPYTTSDSLNSSFPGGINTVMRTPNISYYWVAGSYVWDLVNNFWGEEMFTQDGKNIVIVDKDITGSTPYAPDSTMPVTIYVPKTRKTYWETLLHTWYNDSTIEGYITAKTVYYDFLIQNGYEYKMITLPTLPLTMTDANGNTIDGDFVAQNVTITPAV